VGSLVKTRPSRSKSCVKSKDYLFRYPYITEINEAIVTEYRTLGGRALCERCHAIALKTGRRCRCPAVRGTTLCANHRIGGRGPLTEEGRRRCALARTKTGTDTREARKKHSQKLLELYELELLGRKLGLISGPKTAGRKPVR
jgi:hypothetical protein